MTRVPDAEGASTPRAPRGRPRDAAVDRAILESARTLLADPERRPVSMEAIAEGAGVGKATLYRRWRSPEEIGLALFEEAVRESMPVGDLGDTRAELVALVRQTVELVDGTPLGRIIQALASRFVSDPVLRPRYMEHVIGRRREQVRAILERGIARGDLRPDIDADDGPELLVGPVYYRLLLSGERCDPGMPDRIVDGLLCSWRAGS